MCSFDALEPVTDVNTMKQAKVLQSLIRILTLMLFIVVWAGNAASYGKPLESFDREITVSGTKHTVHVVKVDLSEVRLKVGLAKSHVGPTENLADIAKRYHAMAAINGTFFDAYTNQAIKNPHHTLITDSEIVHLGGVGTVCWFNSRNRPTMLRMKFTVEGSINGSYKWPQRWYAYWINRYPTADTVTIFTPRWGGSTGLSDGVQVVVSRGVVTKIGQGSQPIPSDGFVIYFRNLYHTLHQKFQTGDRVGYRILGKEKDYPQFRSEAKEGIEAGPLLLRDGVSSPDPVAEGFSSCKILSMSCARSAIGFTADNHMLMVTTDGTIFELASIMKSLGCRDALNLDGGASSSLWYDNRYITPPGREISNALLVLPGQPSTEPLPSQAPPSQAVSAPSPTSSPGRVFPTVAATSSPSGASFPVTGPTTSHQFPTVGFVPSAAPSAGPGREQGSTSAGTSNSAQTSQPSGSVHGYGVSPVTIAAAGGAVLVIVAACAFVMVRRKPQSRPEESQSDDPSSDGWSF